MIKKLLGYLAYYTLFPQFLVLILHKIRGVKLENPETTYIGYKVLLDTTMPELITIGDSCLLGREVSIFTHLDIPEKKAAEVRIGQGTFIGPRAIILPGVTIGKYVIIGMGAVVNTDVPDYSVVFGNPARIFGKTNA
ncbi:MAG: acyltransferase [Elusimicrobia bacterium]|nr:acyltransferase [Elusimicrobiota bacterium]